MGAPQPHAPAIIRLGLNLTPTMISLSQTQLWTTQSLIPGLTWEFDIYLFFKCPPKQPLRLHCFVMFVLFSFYFCSSLMAIQEIVFTRTSILRYSEFLFQRLRPEADEARARAASMCSLNFSEIWSVSSQGSPSGPGRPSFKDTSQTQGNNGTMVPS